jgi:hypothetical protein
VTLPGELHRARHLPLRPWASDQPDRYIAVSTDLVSGRRIRGWYRSNGKHAAPRVARP